MKYLQKKYITRINQKTIERHGGNFTPPFNFLHESNLDYVLEAVAAEMFGEPLYPDIHDKAAVYMFNIISNHIFLDGNKRTGLEAALLFLDFNGFEIRLDISNKEVEAFVIKVASGESTLDECRTWFKDNIIENV